MHAKRIEKILSTAVKKEKATVVCGGQSDLKERYIAPTILTDLDIKKSAVMQEEIFGPILGVFKVSDLHEAPDIVRATCDQPLAMYIFAKNRSLIDFLTTNISSGTVLVNDTIFTLLTRVCPLVVSDRAAWVSLMVRLVSSLSQKRGVLRRDDHYFVDVPQRYPPYSNFSIGIFYVNAKLPIMPYIGKWQGRHPPWPSLSFAAYASGLLPPLEMSSLTDLLTWLK